MAYPAKSIVLRWQPDKLGEAAASVRNLADNQRGVRAMTDRMVRAVAKPYDDGRWSGPARAAAEDRADNDSREINRVADTIDDLADIIDTASSALTPVVYDLRQSVTTLGQGLFNVGEDWEVTNMLVGRDNQDERNQYAANETVRLRNLAETAQIIDNDVATKIRANLGEYSIVAPRTSGLGGPEGQADVEALLNGSATPEQITRFSVAATLTDEQIAQLGQGHDTVLTVGQFDYLQSAMNALEGRDIVEITGLADRYGDEAPTVQAALANSLQIASNPNVTTAQLTTLAPAMPGVAERAGFHLLPGAVQTALTERKTERWGRQSIAGRGVGTTIPAVGNLAALTEVLRHGDPRLQQGTDIDRHILARSGEIASSVARLTDDETDVDTRSRANKVEADLQDMLQLASNDHIAVHDALTGDNMPADYNADRSIASLLQNDWNQRDGHADGAGINSTFAWIGADAHSPDPVTSLRAGESADALARIMAAHHDDLMDLPDNDGRALGEVNPELTLTLAESLSPYIPRMVGVPDEMTGTLGFDSFRRNDVEGLFAVFDTSRESALQFNGSAYAAITQLNEAWGVAAVNGDNRSEFAHYAGRLAAAVDNGIQIELDERQTDTDTRARVDFANHQAHYDALKGLAGFPLKFLPISQFAGSALDIVAPVAKLDIVGAVPDAPVESPRVDFSDASTMSRQYYQLLSSMLSAADTGGQAAIFDDLRHGDDADVIFRPDGSLKSYDEVVTGDTTEHGPQLVRIFQDLSIQLGLPEGQYRDQWTNGLDDRY